MFFEIIVSILLATIIPVLTYKKHSLTLIASIESGLIILFCGLCGGYEGLLFLIISYSTIALVDHFVKNKNNAVFENINKKAGTRDAIQVFVNGFPAFVAIILAKQLNNCFFISYIACLAEALSDSLSSDIGVLSHKNPVSLFKFKRIEKGLSGGVSLLGSVSCVVGTLFMSFLYLIIRQDFNGILSIFIGSLIGCFFDTFLGDLFQVKYKCVKCGIVTEKEIHCDKYCIKHSGFLSLDNCRVNFLSNLVSGITSLLIYVWIF